MVICDSVGDRQAWVTDIERQIGECRQARGMDAPAPAAPVWMPDSNQTKCPLCSRAFTVFFRRHHCRKCGQLCCEACSRTRVIQPNISVSHKVRVCDQCRDRIAEQPPPLVFDANVRGAVELGSLAGGEVNTVRSGTREMNAPCPARALTRPHIAFSAVLRGTDQRIAPRQDGDAGEHTRAGVGKGTLCVPYCRRGIRCDHIPSLVLGSESVR